MNNRDYFLAAFLNCKVDECEKLDSIVMDVGEVFEKTSEKTIAGFCKTVYDEALDYLTFMYNFAYDKVKTNPNLYDGSVLKWDSALLKDALEFLNPEKDLHYGFTAHEFYLEMDNWDLYWSVVDTINSDYNSGYSCDYLCSEYCSEFYGGRKQPEKYEPLLL